GAIVDEDLALLRRIEAVEGVHERGLPRSVLPQQRMDLTGFDDEVDRVVGGERAESLGDSSEFELHVRSRLEWEHGAEDGHGPRRSSSCRCHSLAEGWDGGRRTAGTR